MEPPVGSILCRNDEEMEMAVVEKKAFYKITSGKEQDCKGE